MKNKGRLKNLLAVKNRNKKKKLDLEAISSSWLSIYINTVNWDNFINYNDKQNMTLKQLIMRGKVPFDVSIPKNDDLHNYFTEEELDMAAKELKYIENEEVNYFGGTALGNGAYRICRTTECSHGNTL